MGRERARRYSMRCTYYGAAPVTLKDYCDSVAAQSLTLQRPTEADLKRAFSDLMINLKMLQKLGAALNSGRGMFLFGYPGNGKTSIAERVTKAFGETIWIPRAIGVDGEVIRLFDASQHEEIPLASPEGIFNDQKTDARWVRIRRPTIIVGGELTMSNLELAINEATGINEAPVQMKSNCGTLVIDDFGRQRMSTDELLNRWIVPLEKRYDFLNLPSGKKIEVPFDQLVVFSTNLEPKDLVDDAFLRRIPYKIEVENPSEVEFRKLFELMCPKFGFAYNDRALDYLVKKHYLPVQRPFRCCHPRDLLLQVKNICQYQREELVLTPANLDFACDNYFSIV
jgi:predicted ATPase with chaperone activity